MVTRMWDSDTATVGQEMTKSWANVSTGEREQKALSSCKRVEGVNSSTSFTKWGKEEEFI
jgi:hypothetical protein